MAEQWRDIAGREGRYQVSDLGRVRSLPHTVERLNRWGTVTPFKVAGRVRKLQRCSNGYLMVQFTSDGDRALVHRLVAQAFVPGDTSLHVNHKDLSRTNNVSANLEWATRSENMLHGYRTNKSRKVHVWTRPVLVDGVQYASAADAGRAIGVTNGSICSAAKRGHLSAGHEVRYV